MAQVSGEKKVGTKVWPWLTSGLACAVASAACVWIPIHVIRPPRSSPQGLPFLNLRNRARENLTVNAHVGQRVFGSALGDLL
jgi:hypothetical protein